MVDSRIEKMAEWIRTNESKGYSEEQLKAKLLEKGYNINDVTLAITMVKSRVNPTVNSNISPTVTPAIKQDILPQNIISDVPPEVKLAIRTKKVADIKEIFNIKTLFRLTFLKVFLSSILFLIIVLFFVTAPSIYMFKGHVVCNIGTYGNDLSELNSAVIAAQSTDISPEDFIRIVRQIDDYTKKINDEIPALQLSVNKISLVTHAASDEILKNVHVLNPLFPAPCPLLSDSNDLSYLGYQNNIGYCYDFYIPEDRKCVEDIQDRVKRQDLVNAYNNDDNLNVIPVGLLWFILTGIFLVIIFYILLSIMLALLDSIFTLGRLHSIALLIIMLCSIFLSLFLGLDPSIVFFIALMMLLQILLFIHDIRIRNIVIASMFALILIVLCVVMPAEIRPSMSMSRYVDATPASSDYSIVYCSNATTLLQIWDFYAPRSPVYDNINVTYGISKNFSVCYDPKCSDLCKCDNSTGAVYSTHYTLAGIKPSCVCRCRRLG